MLRDISEAFHTLQKINMKLKPKKCTFGAVEGMFLGYMVTPEGIKSYPDKTEAVLQLPFPRTIKEVQCLNGKLASLNRFLFKSAEKSLPLFKTLRKCIKKSDFHWTPKAEQAFKQLKQHLSKLPLLVAPKPNKELTVYLSASYGAISAVLMTEIGTIQTPVYFISRTLQGPELNYTPMEKLVLSLVFTAKRLRRTSVKGQVLADFLTEMPDASVVETQQEPWTLFTDGSSCVDGSGAGLILTSLKRTKFTYALRFQFAASNNEAEYEALIAGLRIVAQMGVQNVYVKILISGFTNFSINQVPRSKNKKADALSKIASTSFAHLSKHVLVEILKEKSIQEKEVTTVVEEDGSTWMTAIMKYLKEGTLPSDRRRKESSVSRPEKYVIREIHEGSCSMHPGPRSVVTKAIRLGYYWPTTHQDARDMIRIDIAGPFGKGPGKVKFLIVAMDYFTKWIEAKAVATITGSQSNGLVEKANQSLGEGIKARLGKGNKNWVEELPHVLWAHRIMIKSSHGDTPFSLTYGTEAVIPAEIQIPTYRTAAVDVVHNDEELWLNLDLLEERPKCAAIRGAKAKLKMTKYYNARVRGVTFRPGDFVYRSNDASHAMDGGKLGPKWEGPYEVIEALGDRAYKLRSTDGIVLPRTWNITNLKRDLDLSNLGEAPSSDVSVCVASSANRIARPCGETVGTDTGTLSNQA
nr:hypothetical protein [Tanacetum cinerariifolium]